MLVSQQHAAALWMEGFRQVVQRLERPPVSTATGLHIPWRAMSKSLFVSPIGLTEKERTVLVVTVRLLSALDFQVDVADEERVADIALIDPETEEGRRYLQGVVTSPIKVMVGAEGSTDGVPHVTRPIMVQRL